MSDLRREVAPWESFALLDSGEFEKCERFGDIVMIRPEPQALWKKSSPDAWASSHLVYSRTGREGEWATLKGVPESWDIRWNDLTFKIRPTSFKHTGLFPEQASNWTWIRENVKPDMKVLNLFGYTGAASLVAASVGAEVVHVDASKPVVTWGRENAELSGLGTKPIRWIVDDVQKFVAREARRGNVYDAIFMDPPAFGRGPEGEIWKFEDGLPALIEQCASILNREHGMLLVNAYSLGFPALAIENAVKTALPFEVKIESVELTLKEENARGFLLPTGVVVRATW
ncbi:MAG: class I SAM-dependent methyltransferase [Candidatus Uhrbacteria bacterium]|nr:class I SAM-dependent methyltransferase [Candidatus Uhrbacteria bacterium]